MTILYKDNKPFVEGVCLNNLSATIETPFYVYSQKSIIDSYNIFLKENKICFYNL